MQVMNQAVFDDPLWGPVVKLIRKYQHYDIILPAKVVFTNFGKRFYSDLQEADSFDIFFLHKDFIFWYSPGFYRNMLIECDILYANSLFIIFSKKRLGLRKKLYNPVHLLSFFDALTDAEKKFPLSKKIVFLHIRKCAGTSLWNSLKSEYTQCVYADNFSLKKRHYSDPDVSDNFCNIDLLGGHIQRQIAHLNIGSEANITWVTIFRDPYERFLSEVNQRRREKNYLKTTGRELLVGSTLQDFVRTPQADNWMNEPALTLAPTQVSADFLRKHKDMFLQEIFDFLSQENVLFGFQESLDDFYRILAEKEIICRVTPPVLNVAKKSKKTPKGEIEQGSATLKDLLALSYEIMEEARKIYTRRFGSLLDQSRQKIFGGRDYLARKHVIKARDFIEDALHDVASGTFLYGPYIHLDRGNYTLTCLLDWSDAPQHIRLEIGNTSDLVLGGEILPGEKHFFSFNIKIPMEKFEVRLHSGDRIGRLLVKIFELHKEESETGG